MSDFREKIYLLLLKKLRYAPDASTLPHDAQVLAEECCEKWGHVRTRETVGVDAQGNRLTVPGFCSRCGKE